MGRKLRKTRLVEDPDFTVGCRFGDTMAIVMKQNSVSPCVFAARQAQLPHSVLGRIQFHLIASLIKNTKEEEAKEANSTREGRWNGSNDLGQPSLVLSAQVLANCLEGPWGRHRKWI